MAREKRNGKEKEENTREGKNIFYGKKTCREGKEKNISQRRRNVVKEKEENIWRGQIHFLFTEDRMNRWTDGWKSKAQ